MSGISAFEGLSRTQEFQLARDGLGKAVTMTVSSWSHSSAKETPMKLPQPGILLLKPEFKGFALKSKPLDKTLIHESE